MSENSPTRTSAPQPEADPETISRAPDSLPANPSGLPTVTGPVATGGSETADGVVPERIGEYLVVRKIGEGGMGSVYLAEDPKLGRKAAIKTMRLELAARKENRDRFVREARAAAAVEHDNIVPIWGIGEATDGTPYIAMPFLQGEMLDTRLKRERVSSVALILDVGRDVADGLAAAHAHNLVHRDIKPANIWLEGDPSAADPGKQVRRAKVLDFGLARSVDQQDTQLTATGAILGTPAFMAPEQARGEAVDHRADLWSLGVTLYRMATGRLPFRGSNTMAVLYSLASEAPPPVCHLNPAVPPALGALVDQLLQKDAALRPQTAAEVAERLRQIAGDRAAPAVSPSVPVLVLPEAGPDPWEGVTEADAADAVVVRPHAPKPRPKPNLLLPAVGVVALSVLFVLLAVVVIKFQTGEGTLTVEISDPGVEARFKGGRLVLYGADGKERYAITPSERNKTVDAGKYTVRVEGADGLALDTSEFTLKKNGEVVVRVTLAAPKAVAKKTGPLKKEDASPDRKAAEWVLGQDGKVIVELPSGLRNVVAAPGALPADPFVLVEVEALNERVRGGDLSNLIGTPRIERITLNNTRVGDDGLELLAQLPTLQRLWLDNIPITDRGLEHLAKLRRLSRLGLFGTTIGDAGLAHLKALPALDYLGLQRTRVTDAGLAHLKDFPALEQLSLDNTAVTDAGLTHLKAIGTLRVCGLPGTKVTAAGIKDFAKAVPRCKIHWDGGVIEPTEKEPDRAAAELVLDLGGKVLVSGTDQDIALAADLPKGPFRVRRLEIPKLTKPLTPAELALFKGLTHLEWLAGTGPGFDDATLLAFADSKKLALVYIPFAKITDAGLAIFKGNDTLGLLNVDGSTITDAGLDHLATCGRLDSFAVGAGLTDAGLEKLKRHRHLTALIVGGPKVTEAGIKDFAKAVPRCQITWAGGTIEPTEKK